MALYKHKDNGVLVDVDQVTAETLGAEWGAVPQRVSDGDTEAPESPPVRTRRGRPARD